MCEGMAAAPPCRALSWLAAALWRLSATAALSDESGRRGASADGDDDDDGDDDRSDPAAADTGAEVLRLPTRETWREHTWWGGETWAGVVRSDWRGRGQAYEVAGRAAPASAAGTLPAT